MNEKSSESLPEPGDFAATAFSTGTAKTTTVNLSDPAITNSNPESTGLTKEEWLERELAKAPVRDEAWRQKTMKIWGLKRTQ